MNPFNRRRLIRFALAAAGAAVSSVAHTAVAAAVIPVTAELVLYGLKLKDSRVADVLKAARAAGAKQLTSARRGALEFDVTRAKVPALTKFEAVGNGPELVAVQFTVEGRDETLRQMLVAKYGQPKGVHDFDREYISDGKYVWVFLGGMQLVYKTTFGGGASLTYSDDEKFERMLDAAKSAAVKDAGAKASGLSSKF